MSPALSAEPLVGRRTDLAGQTICHIRRHESFQRVKSHLEVPRLHLQLVNLSRTHGPLEKRRWSRGWKEHGEKQ